MNKANEKKIQAIYDRVYKTVFTEDVLDDLSKGRKNSLINRITRLETSKSFNDFCKKFSMELTKSGFRKVRGIWRKYYETAKSKHIVGLPKTFHEYEIEMLKETAEKNFEMIKSIPSEMMKLTEYKYAEKLVEEVATGTRSRGSFEKELRKHSVKNAKMIARTESAKIQTSLTESCARELDSVAYMWKAAKDKRTRPSHRAMEGVIVLWRDSLEEKPYLDKMYGNAGEFPNCRCDAQPIFDEDDLPKSKYKLYDYTLKRVVELSKTEILDILKRGQL